MDPMFAYVNECPNVAQVPGSGEACARTPEGTQFKCHVPVLGAQPVQLATQRGIAQNDHPCKPRPSYLGYGGQHLCGAGYLLLNRDFAFGERPDRALRGLECLMVLPGFVQELLREGT